ncbi:SH3 domain-containing protein [Chloroflexota bacterium]
MKVIARVFIMGILFSLFLNSCSTTSSPGIPNPTLVSRAITFIPTITPTKTMTITPTPIPVIGCVISEALNIRKGPGINYDIVGVLNFGDCVTLISYDSDGWVSFSYASYTRWLYMNSLSITGDFLFLSQAPNIIPTKTNTPTKVPTQVPQKTNTPYKTSTQAPTKTSSSILLCANTYSLSGKYVTCKIPKAYCFYRPDVNSNPTFCNDAPYPSDKFTLVAWEQDWSNYNGMCLIVSGYVEIYKGKPQIEGTSRSQVKSCP